MVADALAYVLLPGAGIVLLLATLWVLWIFGATVEDSMSRPRFLALYAGGALVAAGVQALAGTGGGVAVVAASGATAAVLGGYLVLYPRAAVISFLLTVVVEVPAPVLAVLWAGVLLLALGLPTALAPLAGAACGAAVVRVLAQRRKAFRPRIPVY